MTACGIVGWSAYVCNTYTVSRLHTINTACECIRVMFILDAEAIKRL